MRNPRIQQLVADTRDLPPAQRVEAFEAEIKATLAERKLILLDSQFDFQFGGSAVNTNLSFEDPRYDDSITPWDEVGIAGRVHRSRHNRPLGDLRTARDVCRALASENGFAIGAQINRQAYIAGSGVKWRLVPKELSGENEDLTKEANESLTAFLKEEDWSQCERDTVWRADRDGEAILRLFPNARGHLRVRWVEPEFVRAPADRYEVAPNGVEVDPRDRQMPVAYWIGDEDYFAEPKRVRVYNASADLPAVCHLKANVLKTDHRGWPLLWQSRRALIRAEALMRNMSYTTALQTAIALIRTHSASASEIDSFLSGTADAQVTNNLTGKTRNYTGMQPGTIIDAGSGTTYQAPISSVNAANAVEVLRAELRGVAAALNMPDYMISADLAGSSYAASLVAESPFVKHMTSQQRFFGTFWEGVVWSAIKHEVFWNRLPAAVLEDYKLIGDFPTLEVRDFLQESQKRLIEHQAGVLSVTTWRGLAGYDDEIERKNFDRDAEEAPEPEEPEEPEDLQPDEVGGKDQVGDPEAVASAKSSPGFSPAEGLRESYQQGGEVASALLVLARHTEYKPNSILALVAILADLQVGAEERIASALAWLDGAGKRSIRESDVAAAAGVVARAVYRNTGSSQELRSILLDVRYMAEQRIALAIEWVARYAPKLLAGFNPGE